MFISLDIYFKTVFEWLSLAKQFASLTPKNCDFLNTDISHGSVATRSGLGEIFKYNFVTNFLLSLTVKEFWKSLNIWWSYGQKFRVLFFLTHSVVLLCRVGAVKWTITSNISQPTTNFVYSAWGRSVFIFWQYCSDFSRLLQTVSFVASASAMWLAHFGCSI